MSDAGQLGMFLAIGAGFLGFFFGPMAGAMARRIGPKVDAARAAELEELRARLERAELELARLAEVEERLDFAERVLAQREPERLEAETPVP